MIIGVLKEIKKGEHRIALTPAGAVAESFGMSWKPWHNLI
jgi:alanine dehydrogenase